MFHKLDVSSILKEGFATRGKLALIEGDKGYVVTTNDFVHWKYSLDEEAEFELWREAKDGKIDVFPAAILKATLNELRTCLCGSVELDKWGHYFGIKARVRSNYQLLQESCKEIRAKIDFPEWGNK